MVVPGRRQRRIYAGFAAVLLLCGNIQAPDPLILDQLRALRNQDAAVAELGLALTTANASLCEDLMPVTGTVLHAQNQYPAAVATAASQLFAFGEIVAVSSVVPGSPADRAGLQRNDGVISAAGIIPPARDADSQADTLVRDGFETALAALPPDQAQAWRIRRGAAVLDLRILPQPGCRARFEVVPGQALIARNDGQLIQLSSRYVESMSRDELAVILAHELAHSVMRHRQRLVDAGVSKGLLAEFGRNGRLNRRVEREADRLTPYLLRNAGFDPAAAVRFWEGPGRKLGGGLLRSRTHDSPRARAAALRAEIGAMPTGSGPLAPPWLDQRQRPLD